MSVCTNITVKDFLDMQDINVRLVDIRNETEYAQEHIPGAECIPMHKLSDKNFSQNDVVVFHDQAGNRMKLAQKLIGNLKLSGTFILEGGLLEWKRALQKTEVSLAPQKKSSQFPKVRIALGALILCGLAVSYNVPQLLATIQSLFDVGFAFADQAGILDWQVF